MKRYPLTLLLIAASFTIAASGCSPSKPIYLNDPGTLSYYLDQATAVEYPDADIASLDEVTQALQPMTVIDPEFTSFEDITLEDAVSIALLNSKITRGYGTPALTGTRVSPGQDNLTINPIAAATTFDVAIRESEPGFIGQPGAIANPAAIVTNTALDGNQGVEAALADFDTQYTSSFNLATTDEPRNGTSILNNAVFTQTQFTWQNEFAKRSANGTQLFFRNINQYTENNNPLVGAGGIQELDSLYRTSLEAEIRQPLLRGRGTFIQRMPIVISRISTDQEITNVEANLQNMVTNVEIRYWDLYLAYRNFEAAKKGRDAALETYRIVKDQFDEGAEVNIQNVAQAKDQYFFFDEQLVDAYNNLLNAEGQLRFLMGWSATDGRFIRPIDEPVTAPIEFDWLTSMCEALTYRPIVRRQRWEIKKRELGLQYAMNGLLPELNISMVYRWLGLGNKYGVSGDADPFFQGNPPVWSDNSGAWNELLGGNYQELALGGTFAMPIGFRREQANVRNAELKLSREIARGEDLELDINKELSEVIRALAANQAIMRKAFNRWIATTEEVEHFERLEDAGVENLDVALDSQRRRAQAEIAFYNALAEYNKCVALMHRRKGTILAYSGVEISEGPWPGKAYIDAEEHARRRTASRQINYGWTRPQVISRGTNMTPAGNTGDIAPANQLPLNPSNSGAASNDDSVTGGILLEGPVETTPYYETQPVYEAQPVGTGQSAPADFEFDATTARIDPAVNAVVRQVSFDQPVATAQIKTQPVAVRRSPRASESKFSMPVDQSESVRPERPRRDEGTQPVNRLRAQTNQVSTSAGQKPQTSNPNPGVNQNRAVLRTGNLQWERLGLTRPAPQTATTTARIKTN